MHDKYVNQMIYTPNNIQLKRLEIAAAKYGITKKQIGQSDQTTAIKHGKPGNRQTMMRLESIRREQYTLQPLYPQFFPVTIYLFISVNHLIKPLTASFSAAEDGALLIKPPHLQ